MSKDQILVLIGIIFGPLLAYVGVVRRLSGKISHSEASDLWAESRSIREEYKDQVEKLERRVQALEEERAQLRDELRAVAAENGRLKRMKDELEEVKKQNAQLHVELEEVREENKELKVRIAELEKNSHA